MHYVQLKPQEKDERGERDEMNELVIEVEIHI
jgi:hypothetical protein